MREIQLTRGLVALVDDDDYEWLNSFKWFANPHHGGSAYAARTVRARANGKTLQMHRLICGDPDGFEIDHINGTKLDTRRCNLRLCSRHENQRNRPASKRSKTGVFPRALLVGYK